MTRTNEDIHEGIWIEYDEPKGSRAKVLLTDNGGETVITVYPQWGDIHSNGFIDLNIKGMRGLVSAFLEVELILADIEKESVSNA